MPPYGKKEGIHWHMNINNQVYYVATDEKRQVIPWVRKVGPDGKEEIFVEEGSGYSDAKLPKGEVRRMDCMDCHNRPSHIFKSPSKAVDEALAYGAIDSSLPFFKRESVKALLGQYSSHKEAAVKIREQLESFYQNKYQAVFSEKKEILNKNIETTVKIYQANFFPKMKTSWKEYPNNIGHLIFPGCFRCHDGKHRTVEGKVIRNNCIICHSIIAQGPPSAMEADARGLEFKHPVDIGNSWKETACYDCHTGGSD